MMKQYALLTAMLIFLAACSSLQEDFAKKPPSTTDISVNTPYAPPTTAASIGKEPSEEASSIQPPSGLWRHPVPAQALDTKYQLESVDTPSRDLVDLTRRLSDPGQPIPRVVRDEPWGFEIGDSHQFWLLNWDTGQYSQIMAQLVYETDHLYFFVQEDVQVDLDLLKSTAERFENQTYPTNHQHFGKEWTPGIDADPHLTIVVARDIGRGISGYQNSGDEFSHLVNRYSNEMEIIYLNADGLRLDDPATDCLLAHEFTHVIQWSMDPGETTWLNEGTAILACQVNGFHATGIMDAVNAFADQPDIQLNTWSGQPEQVYAEYGASYLFTAYIFDRFGKEAIRALVADQYSGLYGLDQVVENLGIENGFDDVFADWIVANFISTPKLGDGRYGYLSLALPPFTLEDELRAIDLPAEKLASVTQYGTDYVELHGPGDFMVDFAGATLVQLAPLSAHSGDYIWWGGRANNGDATLTRQFDLTDLGRATLYFHVWHEIERDRDYAYVEVSLDGELWETLSGWKTTAADPNGANFGNGFTGNSGGWVQEQVDLTPYVGQNVTIRFQYLTDDGPLGNGIFLDDIQIPELSYYYDVETGDGGWNAKGFIRHTLILPQEWLVQLMILGDERTVVERLQLDSDNSGRWIIEVESGETGVLAISGMTRWTTEPAKYWYSVTPVEE